jgi:peptidyl-prolyl cis-trans isomerase A (cyclophilin A)
MNFTRLTLKAPISGPRALASGVALVLGLLCATGCRTTAILADAEESDDDDDDSESDSQSDGSDDATDEASDDDDDGNSASDDLSDDDDDDASNSEDSQGQSSDESDESSANESGDASEDESNETSSDGESEDSSEEDSSQSDSSGEDSTTETETGTEDGGEVPCTGEHPLVRFETSMGVMDIELDRVNAPKTVDNFAAYVDSKAYDGVIFHRVIDNFVIQGGGFLPGMKPIETMPPIELEISPELRHVDGAISMARTDDPDSANSQFFICDGAQTSLDDNYAAFGVLVAGESVLRDIAAVKTSNEVPTVDVVMTRVYCVSPQ